MTGFLDHQRRRFVLLAAGLLLFGSSAVSAVGCSTETTPGDSCKGGFEREIYKGKVCEPLCDPAKCKAGNVCSNNRCALVCDSHADCWAATQSCTAATDDTTETAVTVCVDNGHWPVDGYPSGSYGQACPFGDADCYGFACPNGMECDPMAPADCMRDEYACFGFEEGECNIGITEDNQRCTLNTCDAAQCTQLNCLSAGEGDADSYCTHPDCEDDSHCPSGFYCGVTRDAHDICGNTCSGGSCSHDSNQSCKTDADCQKGNNNFCGKTLEPCVDPSAFGANGASFFEGSLCLLRRTCKLRKKCAPCTTNLDCSIGGTDVCADVGGEKGCALFCTEATHCRADELCQAYGNTCAANPSVDCTTGEDCPTAGDQCVARSVCVPASGSCRATNASGDKFCHKCLDDTDCGDKDSSMGCAQVGNGEFGCFDMNFGTSCTTDNDCPTSPSGAHGVCLDDKYGVSMSHSLYHRCYFPYNEDKGFTCWP